MKLYLKNMVCGVCIAVVRQQLENLGFSVKTINLGKVEINPDPSADQLDQLTAALEVLGLPLINNDKEILVEGVKTIIIELIHHREISEKQDQMMLIIADRLHKDYAYLSRLFSEMEPLTIEGFIIQQKIEKVKELLQYGELNMNEIAFKLCYSSSAHLSAQFKAVTGLTPSQFKTSKEAQRRGIDKV